MSSEKPAFSKPKDDQPPAPMATGDDAICGEASFRFRKEHSDVFEFLFFGAWLAEKADDGRLAAARALAIGGQKKDLERLERIEANPKPIFSKFQSFASMQSQMLLVRIVDNFLGFLSELLQHCIKRQPNLLRSNEQIKIEEILDFKDQDEMIEFLINRKINRLSYGGIKKISEFFREQISVDIAADDLERNSMNLSIELRNIYTHNRGVVNEVFVSRTSEIGLPDRFSLGGAVETDYDDLVSFANTLFKISERLDGVVCRKYGLQQKAYSEWRDA